MTRRRAATMAIMSVLLAGLLGTARSDISVELQVLESVGVGAAVGTITRIPAESPGGAVYASTTLTLDKGIGRAAGFYPGFLVDAFFRTSVPGYANPTEAVAQFPPGAHPPEASVEGGQQNDAAEVATFHARADDAPEVTARAVVIDATPAGAEVVVGGGRATSHSAVGDDGTVVTEVNAVASRIEIGGVVTIRAAETTVSTTAPPGGEPSTEVRTSVTGVMVAGIPVRLGDEGLVVANETVATPADIATVTAALEQLGAAGIEIRPVPVERATAPGHADASAAALSIRITETSSATSEEIVLAQAAASATSIPAGELDAADAVADAIGEDAGLGGDGLGVSGAVTTIRPGSADRAAASPVPGAVTAPPRLTGEVDAALPAAEGRALASRFQTFYGALVGVVLAMATVITVLARRQPI